MERMPGRLRSARLCLVPGTAGLVRLERTDPRAFADALGVSEPSTWPPPLLDEEALASFEEELRKGADQEGWWCWYVLARDDGAEETLVGGIGFRGPPDAGGMTEVGYSMLPDFHGRGYATEALRTLLAWAFRNGSTRRIIAETYPTLYASIRVLEKTGFRRAGAGMEKGTIRFEITREEFESRAVSAADGPAA